MKVSKYSPPLVKYATIGDLYEVAGWTCKFTRFRDLEPGDRFFLPKEDYEDWPFSVTARTVFEKVRPFVAIKNMNFICNAVSLRKGVSGRHKDDDIVLAIQGPYKGEEYDEEK